MADSKEKKASLRVDVQDSELTYSCEWGECEEQFNDIPDFLRHIGGHIWKLVSTLTTEEKGFSCGWRDCGTQILGDKHDFNRHVYFHAFHVKLKCVGAVVIKKTRYPVCTIDGQSRNWIPELPESLQCGWTSCGAVCDNPVIFYNHVAHHCEEFPNGNNIKGGCLCRWTDCDARFKSKHKLREHLRSHTQEKVVACPTCGGLFASRTKLFDHLTRQKETVVRCYQCSHCNKRFATERILRDHMRHHVNHYKCPFCDMTCPAPSGLRAHIRYRHTMEKPFKCAHCEHCAKSGADLRRHLESHSKDSLFQCHIDKCRYKARSYTSLTNHYRKEHQILDTSRYFCHVCEKRFTRGNQLTKHLKKQHKFKWPPGHSRFRYKVHEDGTLRLQTIRYESIEVSDEIMENEAMQDDSHEAGMSEREASESEEMSEPPTPKLLFRNVAAHNTADTSGDSPNPQTPHSPQSTLLSMPDFPPQLEGHRQGTLASHTSMPGFCMDSHTGEIQHSEGPQATSSGAFQEASSSGFQGSSSGGFQGSSSGGFQGSSSGGFQGSSSGGFQGSSSGGFQGSSSGGFQGSSSDAFQGSTTGGFHGYSSGGFQGTSSAGFQASACSKGSVSGASQGSDGSHARHLETTNTHQGDQDEASSEKACTVQSGSSINITFISNPGLGESQIQALAMDEDGILVYRKPEQDRPQGQSTSPEDGVSLAEAQQKVTSVQPAVPQDNTAYNLQMLGDVALLGQNLSTAQSSSVFGDNGKVIQNL
ncbi:histone H4 transcription factor-like [Haliotis rufescens]|uniref:histone H4 transcription factor-like n=1 Tax=Haliotis rufescens TaxID=6454 RepID=UPI00201E9BFC|nr:histone H4 transcription factor-like [Haliotis rufescens]